MELKIRYGDKVFAGTMNMEAFVNHMGYQEKLPKRLASIVAPVVRLGTMGGGLLAGWICDWLGKD